jgi:DNA-binding MarR family transcriptional regulator
MNLPPEFFATELTATEFKVVVSLYHLSGPEWLVEATTDELGVLTGYSAESLRRAFRGLEKAGLLDTVRTKRNFGKWSKNRYQLVLPSHKLWIQSLNHPSYLWGGQSHHPTNLWGQHVVLHGYLPQLLTIITTKLV